MPKSLLWKISFTVSDADCSNKLVLRNAFSSYLGLSNFPLGAVIYNSATSFPATFPVLVMVTVAMI